MIKLKIEEKIVKLPPTKIKKVIHGDNLNRMSSSVYNESIGLSRWVTPKRTRSYPFARMIKTMHLDKRITIIPVVKDEGLKGDQDKTNFASYSLANTMGFYIIYVHIISARKNPRRSGKITGHTFSSESVWGSIDSIIESGLSHSEWNRQQLENIHKVFEKSVNSYNQIFDRLGVIGSSKKNINNLIELMKESDNREKTFSDYSRTKSVAAMKRESRTEHLLEDVLGEEKGEFHIETSGGGELFLTSDGYYNDNGVHVITEYKNSSKTFPSNSDIYDGLFKLCLFSMSDGDIRPRLGLTYTDKLSKFNRLKPWVDETLSIIGGDLICQKNKP